MLVSITFWQFIIQQLTFIKCVLLFLVSSFSLFMVIPSIIQLAWPWGRNILQICCAYLFTGMWGKQWTYTKHLQSYICGSLERKQGMQPIQIFGKDTRYTFNILRLWVTTEIIQLKKTNHRFNPCPSSKHKWEWRSLKIWKQNKWKNIFRIS